MKTSTIHFATTLALFAAACAGSPAEGPTTQQATVATVAVPPTPPPSAVPPKEIAPAPAEKTLAQKMAETTKALVDAWNTHDADKVAAAYTENGSLRLIGLSDFTGRAAIKAHAADTLKAFPDFKMTLTRVVTKDAVEFAEWVITGTNTGDSDMMKIKATKRPMGIHGADVIVYDDAGLIKEARRYVDVPTQMAQLDAKAKAGTFRAVASAPTTPPLVLVSRDTPEEQKNISTLKTAMAAYRAHELPGAIAHVHPDAVLEDYTEPGSAKGAGSRVFMEQVFKAIPDAKVESSIMFGAGEFVVSENHFQGTLKGNLGPVKATNKPFDVHTADIVQMRDGKLVAGFSYGNGMEVAPPPASKKLDMSGRQ